MMKKQVIRRAALFGLMSLAMMLGLCAFAPTTTQAYSPVAALDRQQFLVKSLLAAPANAPLAAVTGPTQSHDPANPGSDVYAYSSYSVNTYNIWHMQGLALYPTAVTYLVPTGTVPTGGFPVIAVSPGKFLDSTSNYDQLLRHFTLKGYITLFIDTDTGIVDCQHSRMAGEFLDGIKKTINNKLSGKASNPPKVAWWGHSMGAKVEALAARMTTNSAYIAPTAIIANNFSNNNGGVCSDDAIAGANTIPASIWYTLIKGDNDTVAGSDPQNLYNAIPQVTHRQLITVVSYTDINLNADHYAPMTNYNILVGGTLDALDWWLYWKVAVGAFNYHFKGGSDIWAYGSQRTNGGIDSSGRQILHQVS
ncbi:hypothetical protein [Candidatus Chlorohelix sp.]|uniref:hypothetical protein n=1 Tax=Candidatus Chlorohelix sp. TaxID=3139201 RepID=UPI00307442A8